ncbi:hypothetical protein FB479_101773 [Brevibacillus sp. AG162]|uniref:hypothetical protein n=1 Tax=Brevibacillus sp. AG162 TaxID=2572910 RepID=UPI00114EEF4F|nr:hypothetical protein [Brevibacillus sp. AG162]TQK75161.1 hypothetical protein FB479_101773 [Brevibacillus sp. AG162]
MKELITKSSVLKITYALIFLALLFWVTHIVQEYYNQKPIRDKIESRLGKVLSVKEVEFKDTPFVVKMRGRDITNSDIEKRYYEVSYLLYDNQYRAWFNGEDWFFQANPINEELETYHN